MKNISLKSITIVAIISLAVACNSKKGTSSSVSIVPTECLVLKKVDTG